MSEIEPLLQSFVGYVELGMYEDAGNELDRLPLEMQQHPTVQLARLDLLVEMKRWREGAALGESLCVLWPQELEFWFKTAFCQHELKRTVEARQTLLNAPAHIRKSAVFYYNLACYETQLGELLEGKRLLEKACEMDKRFRRDSLRDPDLQPLWTA
jgi:thioredoxin-like negative regulator of GroEL